MARSVSDSRRPNTAKMSTGKENVSFSKIIILQLLLCALILVIVVAVKFIAVNTYDSIKQSYDEIISESYTGKLLSDNLSAAMDTMTNAFSAMGQSDKTIETGMGGEMPVSSFVKTSRKKAPSGTTVSPLIMFANVEFPIPTGQSYTSYFGYRTHPITGKPDFHNGLDIPAPRGTRISAAIGGTVKEIGFTDVDGNYIVLDHGNALETIYCHCDKILAPQNARIKKGEVIALVGSTGMATGPHLHFEVRHKGVLADPMWAFSDAYNFSQG